MKQEGLDAYGRRLFERRGTALVVSRLDLSMNGWRPSEKRCHNVTRACEEDPRYKAVRGWLIFDLRPLAQVVRFTAHSVIRCPDGSLRDITPAKLTQDYPFPVAEDTEAGDAALIDGLRVSALDYDVHSGRSSVLVGQSA